MDRLTVGREKLNFEYFYKMALATLYDAFASDMENDGNKRPTFDEFGKTYLDFLHANPIKGDEFIVQAEAVNKGLSRKQIFVAAVLYLREAIVASEDGQSELAWTFLVDTLYLCGYYDGSENALSFSYLDRSVDSSSDLSLVEELVEATIRSKIGIKNNKKKNQGYPKVIEYTFELIKTQRPPLKGWPSPRNAALHIHSQVQEWSESNLTKPLASSNSFNYVYQILRSDKERFLKLNSGEELNGKVG